MTSSQDSPPPRPEGWFGTTHWSVVLSARDHSEAALEKLCRSYWYPLYAFVRRQGRSPEDAEDLVQGFFARLLQKDFLKAVEPERGRFRTFLMMAMKRFMANEWDRRRAWKRGGPAALLPLDTGLAESRYQAERATDLPAEAVFDRQWAIALLGQTLSRLQEEHRTKPESFAVLSPFLAATEGAASYAEAAAKLGQTQTAVRMAVSRLRRRFREIFREEIAQTMAKPEDVQEEVRYLLRILSQ